MNKVQFDSISIIVTTKNSLRTIEQCISALLVQKAGVYGVEIIVVDNFSTDGTAEYLKSLEIRNLIRLYSLGPERSEQRNFGISKATYDIVGYVDSDMYLTQDLLRKVMDSFNVMGIDAVKVPEIILGNRIFNRARRFERMLYSDTYIDSARFFKKSIFNSVGGFRAGIPGAEDWELDAKMIAKGATFYFLESAESTQNESLRSYPINFRLDGFIHDESDLSFREFMKKKIYYKAADEKLATILRRLRSPMLRVFKITYRLGLIFTLKKFVRYFGQYRYLPLVFVYRLIHIMVTRIFRV